MFLSYYPADDLRSNWRCGVPLKSWALLYLFGMASNPGTIFSTLMEAGMHIFLCGASFAKSQHLSGRCTLCARSMTELGHGSNVMGIETTAVYDEAAGEFVINTPTDTASKFWIGGAAQHGKARSRSLCPCLCSARQLPRALWRSLYGRIL